MPSHESPSLQEYRSIFEANKSWFHAHRARLLEEHPDPKYVAISEQKPVVFGDLPGDVADAFYSAFRAQPVYVGKLSSEPEVEVLSSPSS